MGCFEKFSWNAGCQADDAWVEISGFDETRKAQLWAHLRAFHPGLASLLGNVEQTGFARVPGAEIWIERRYLPVTPAG